MGALLQAVMHRTGQRNIQPGLRKQASRMLTGYEDKQSPERNVGDLTISLTIRIAWFQIQRRRAARYRADWNALATDPVREI